jgi:hypothetical protein
VGNDFAKTFHARMSPMISLVNSLLIPFTGAAQCSSFADRCLARAGGSNERVKQN